MDLYLYSFVVLVVFFDSDDVFFSSDVDFFWLEFMYVDKQIYGCIIVEDVMDLFGFFVDVFQVFF